MLDLAAFGEFGLDAPCPDTLARYRSELKAVRPAHPGRTWQTTNPSSSLAAPGANPPRPSSTPPEPVCSCSAS